MQPNSAPDRKYSTLEKVQEELRGKGMSESQQPGKKSPDVPANLMNRGGDFVVELYRELEAWYSYVLYQHAVAHLLAVEWKNDLNLLLKALASLGKEPGAIETDERTIAMRQELQIHEQQEELWGVEKSKLDRRMKLVSRAVEVMKMDNDTSRRARSVGDKPWPGY